LDADDEFFIQKGFKMNGFCPKFKGGEDEGLMLMNKFLSNHEKVGDFQKS